MITDAMVEAGCTKYLDLMVEATGNEDEVVAPEFMRAALEAALAVQPVPTDAEIERAIDRLELATIEWARSNEPSRTTASTGPLGDKTVELHDALLRLIAQQQPKKVFLAVRPDYEGLSIYGVFLTEGEAEQRVRELGVEDHRVYDYEVGVPL